MFKSASSFFSLLSFYYGHTEIIISLISKTLLFSNGFAKSFIWISYDHLTLKIQSRMWLQTHFGILSLTFLIHNLNMYFFHSVFHNSCFVLQAAYVLSKYQYFVCPVEYRSDVNSFVTECEPSELFRLQSYSLPPFLKAVLRRVR